MSHDIAIRTDTAAQAGTRAMRLRSSCDRCQDTKLKCTQTKPACWRCVRLGVPCVYSPIRRLGRPRKDTNPPKPPATASKTTPPASDDALSPPPGRRQQQQHRPMRRVDSPHSSEASGHGEIRVAVSPPAWDIAEDLDSRSAYSPPVHHRELSKSPTENLAAAEAVSTSAQSDSMALLIDPALDHAGFDATMEDLTSTKAISYEALFSDISFHDLSPWEETPEEGAVLGSRHFPHDITGAPPWISVLTPIQSVDATTTATVLPSRATETDAYPAEGGILPRDTLTRPHRQPFPPAISQSAPRPFLCDSDCQGCLTRQLAEVNSYSNCVAGLTVDKVLQLDRNTQLLSRRLLHCLSCLANGSSVVLLSIILDQVVRLLERLMVRADLTHSVSDARHPSRVSRRPVGPSPGAGHQPPGLPTDLRIGEYELLEEDFKLNFLKRLVSHRLRLLVETLGELQYATSGNTGGGEGCDATYQSIVERVDRIRGIIAL